MQVCLMVRYVLVVGWQMGVDVVRACLCSQVRRLGGERRAREGRGVRHAESRVGWWIFVFVRLVGRLGASVGRWRVWMDERVEREVGREWSYLSKLVRETQSKATHASVAQTLPFANSQTRESVNDFHGVAA